MPRALLIPLIVATALFMENMDGTVLATSLPAIALEMHQDPIVLKLALTSYMLTLAVFIPASGWVADRVGARTVFSWAIAVFTLGSILCGFSTSLGTLVAARIFQGLGGAMMVPVGRLVLLRSVPRSEIVGALAYLTIPALLGPIAGPPLGGFITTYYHWRWIFWINVPIGVLGIALVFTFIENLREIETPPFDFRGFALSGFGLASFVFGLTVLGRPIVPIWVDAVMIVGGLAALAAYVRHARTCEDAIIDLRLLRIPSFFAGIVGGFLFRVGVAVIPFLLPLTLQLGFGLSPFESGSLTFSAAAGSMAMKFAAPAALRRWGFRNILIVNSFICAVFLSVHALFTPATPHSLMLVVFLIGGFFRSLQFTSLTALCYADLEPARMSRATSFTSVVQQMSTAIGVAVAAAAVEALQFGYGDDRPGLREFSGAFLVVAAVSLASTPIFWRLRPNVGAEIAAGRAGAASAAE